MVLLTRTKPSTCSRLEFWRRKRSELKRTFGESERATRASLQLSTDHRAMSAMYSGDHRLDIYDFHQSANLKMRTLTGAFVAVATSTWESRISVSITASIVQPVKQRGTSNSNLLLLFANKWRIIIFHYFK